MGLTHHLPRYFPEAVKQMNASMFLFLLLWGFPGAFKPSILADERLFASLGCW
jgi:hypothetical protein